MLNSFSGKCAKLMLPSAKNHQYIDEDISEKYIGLVTPTKAFSPHVLIAVIDNDIFKFTHYNFTITGCIWPKPMTLTQKAIVFRGISEKINLNHSFSAILRDSDDNNAFEIHKYIENMSKYS
tara:strand:+ start:1070 stop:1435 length:366 start_codon:yes stop_codon:yes gene_type:complete